jgi:hypothetical protein
VSKKAGLADKYPRNLAAQWLIETADEAEHRWLIQTSNILEDEIWKSFKGNQSGKHYPESRSPIRQP